MSFWGSIVSFFASALAAMGVGGGGFMVIYLTLALNMEQLQAQGINLILFLAGSMPGLLIHVFKRRINFFAVILFSVFGVAGTFFGAYILRAIPALFLRKAFGAMLAVLGCAALFRKKR